jgi:hypothetical protein
MMSDESIPLYMVVTWRNGSRSGEFDLYGVTISAAREAAHKAGYCPRVWYNPFTWLNYLVIYT